MRRTYGLVGTGCPRLIVVASIYLYRCARRNRYNMLRGNYAIGGSRALPLLTGITMSRTRTNTSVVTPSGVVSNCIGTVHRTLSTTNFGRVPVVTCSTGFTSTCCNPFHTTTSSTPSTNSHGNCRVSPTGDSRTLHRITLSVRRNTSVIVIGPTLTFLSIMRHMRRAFGHPLYICGIDNRCTVIGTTTRGN